MTQPYIQTYSGKKLTFLHPNPDDIIIADIAFSLANQCRFNGHIPFYSVAEHCVAVSSRLAPSEQLAGLLHDASEAYLSDIPSPIKEYLPDYAELEWRVQMAINKKFDVHTHTDAVKQADKDATYTEAHYLLEDGGKDWVPSTFKPRPPFYPFGRSPEKAYEMFMKWFEHLTKEKQYGT